MRSIYLFALTDWWPALGIIPVVIGILTAWRSWRDSELSKVRIENKDLKKDNARLTREALIRIDDLQDQYRQIDELQAKVIEQRKRRQELIEGDKD